MSKNHKRVIEFAEAALVPGVSAQQLADGIASSTRFLKTCDGFIRRRSVRDVDTFADIAERRDMKSAKNALAASETSADCAPLFALFDMASARMRHFDVVE
jgi:hypothetical protein